MQATAPEYQATKQAGRQAGRRAGRQAGAQGILRSHACLMQSCSQASRGGGRGGAYCAQLTEGCANAQPQRNAACISLHPCSQTHNFCNSCVQHTSYPPASMIASLLPMHAAPTASSGGHGEWYRSANMDTHLRRERQHSIAQHNNPWSILGVLVTSRAVNCCAHDCLSCQRKLVLRVLTVSVCQCMKGTRPGPPC